MGAHIISILAVVIVVIGFVSGWRETDTWWLMLAKTLQLISTRNSLTYKPAGFFAAANLSGQYRGHSIMLTVSQVTGDLAARAQVVFLISNPNSLHLSLKGPKTVQAPHDLERKVLASQPIQQQLGRTPVHIRLVGRELRCDQKIFYLARNVENARYFETLLSLMSNIARAIEAYQLEISPVPAIRAIQ